MCTGTVYRGQPSEEVKLSEDVYRYEILLDEGKIRTGGMLGDEEVLAIEPDSPPEVEI